MKIKNPKTPVSKIVIFLMLLASMIFISCENSLMPRDESEAANQFKNEKDERAYIVFSLKNNGEVSKNIVSDFSRFSFTNVEFSGTCGSKTVSKTAETFEGLAGQQIFVDVGNWNFTLTADYGTEKYKATKTVPIHSGANSIEMKLEADTSASGGVAYNPAEHPGSYEITLKFPSDNIDVVKFEIKKMDDTIVHSEDKIKGTDYSGSGMKTIVYSADSFDPGFYIIHFGFKSLKGKDPDGNDIYEQINDWGDILTINPGALSKGTLTLPKSEPVYSISYNLNGGSWKSTYDGNFYFSYTAKTKETDLSGVEHNYLTLPTRTALQRDGYRFLGWFESSDFSGEEVTQLNVSAKQNKTYYAKWEEFTDGRYATITQNSTTTSYSNKTALIAALESASGNIELTLYGKVTASDIFATSDSIKDTITSNDNISVTLIVDPSANIMLGENCLRAMFGVRHIVSADLRGLNTSAVTTMSQMFSLCSDLEELNLTGWDTSSVTSMEYMFNECTALTTILGINGWNTSSVENMLAMFNQCGVLTNLNIGSWDTSKVNTMRQMFTNCSLINNLDLSGWDTSSVTDMSVMFEYCEALTNLNLSGWDTSKVTDTSFMFAYMSAIEVLDIRDFSYDSIYECNSMFRNCTSLTTIITDNEFTLGDVIGDVSYIFYSCTNLVGGAGTEYDETVEDINYAHVDGAFGGPGYFTSPDQL